MKTPSFFYFRCIIINGFDLSGRSPLGRPTFFVFFFFEGRLELLESFPPYIRDVAFRCRCFQFLLVRTIEKSREGIFEFRYSRIIKGFPRRHVKQNTRKRSSLYSYFYFYFFFDF